MIIKFFRHGKKSNGSCDRAINYLIGKNNDRVGATVIKGDPRLTAQIADNSPYSNTYTSGVLSCEESELSHETKLKMIERFENAMFAGLDKDRYSIAWIEHSDKGRVELNFVVANVELETGKRLQPYFDKADRPLVENLKQCMNYEFGLSDPNDPAKTQHAKIDPYKLPSDVKDIKERISTAIGHQIALGTITDQKGVVNALQGAGFTIARVTDKGISIENPQGKRNIRLTGAIYENRQLSPKLGAEYAQASDRHREQASERYNTATSRLETAIAKRHAENTAKYQRNGEPSRPPASNRERTKRMVSEQSADIQSHSGRENGLDSVGRTVGVGVAGGAGNSIRDLQRQKRPAGTTGGATGGSASTGYDTERAESVKQAEHSAGFEQEQRSDRSDHQARRNSRSKGQTRNRNGAKIDERIRASIDTARQRNAGNAGIKRELEQREQAIAERKRDFEQRSTETAINSHEVATREPSIESTARTIERHKRAIEQRKSTLERLTQRLSEQVQRIREQISEFVEKLKKEQAPPPIEPKPAENRLKIGKMWTIKELRDAGLNTKQAELVSNAQKKTQQFGSSKNGERLQAFQNQALQHIEQGTIDQHIRDLQDKDRGR